MRLTGCPVFPVISKTEIGVWFRASEATMFPGPASQRDPDAGITASLIVPALSWKYTRRLSSPSTIAARGVSFTIELCEAGSPVMGLMSSMRNIALSVLGTLTVKLENRFPCVKDQDPHLQQLPLSRSNREAIARESSFSSTPKKTLQRLKKLEQQSKAKSDRTTTDFHTGSDFLMYT